MLYEEGMDLADIFCAGGLSRFREWNLPNRVSALIKQRAHRPTAREQLLV